MEPLRFRSADVISSYEEDQRGNSTFLWKSGELEDLMPHPNLVFKMFTWVGMEK